MELFSDDELFAHNPRAFQETLPPEPIREVEPMLAAQERLVPADKAKAPERFLNEFPGDQRTCIFEDGQIFY